jgi:RNA polymerase sigma-70 factor (ECF subfamily)
MRRVDEFERLAVPHMGAAFSLAFWLTRSRSDAEDTVQDAYLRAYRGFAGFSGGDIKPWLLAIVRNAAYRLLGNRRRGSNIVSFDEAFQTEPGEEPGVDRVASDAPTPELLLIRDGERAGLLAALETLAPTLREVLVLRELEGMTYREIASVIGAPIGTVMSRLARGREQLRSVLTAHRKKEA